MKFQCTFWYFGVIINYGKIYLKPPLGMLGGLVLRHVGRGHTHHRIVQSLTERRA